MKFNAQHPVETTQHGDTERRPAVVMSTPARVGMGPEEPGQRQGTVGERIVAGLREFENVLLSGKPLEQQFKITVLSQVNTQGKQGKPMPC